jgi:hypothetical protein
VTEPVTEPVSAVAPPLVERPTLLSLLRLQRKVITVALVLMLASFWMLSTLADWTTAACGAGGVLLGLLNHLQTEYWLGRIVSSGNVPTRPMLTRATIVRLGLLSIIAIAVLFAFGRAGVAMIFGLAIFRLVALVMTTLPLLKELKEA